MKKKSISLSILIFILAVAAGAYLFICNQVTPVSKTDSDSIHFEIPYGLSTYQIIENLYEKNLIKNPKICYTLAKHPQLMKFLYPLKNSSSSFSLKSGSYSLNQTMTFGDILIELSSGHQEYIKVVVPEGLTISQIARLLEENKICMAADFKESCHDSKILASYNIKGETCEGYLFPETYFLNLHMDSDKVVTLMIDTFFEKIKTIQNYETISPENLSDIVTLASIVEKEYKLEEEAPLIASVFKNRLRRNIGLYSCATIVYIITEIEGRPHPDRVLTRDTKIDNPYNTYKWAGLPPGPISNPGITALSATINTPKTKYYYFQVKDEEKGSHVFTTTFEEHITNH